jgi:Ca-activated chloride channel homolog
MTSMNFRLRVAGRLFGLALLFTPAALAQTPAAGPTAPPAQPAPAGALSSVPQTTSNGQADGNFTIRTNVNEVNLIFTVTDKHGRFIPNLQQRDFALLDNQKAPAQVFNFTQQTNLPLRVGILIDASTSIRQRFEFEQNAAIQFLQQVVRPQTDLAFVMGFDVTP